MMIEHFSIPFHDTHTNHLVILVILVFTSFSRMTDQRKCILHIGKKINEEVKAFDEQRWQMVHRVKSARETKPNHRQSKYWEICQTLTTAKRD